MSNEFEYNAPRFVDFKDALDDSDGADTFFDVEGTPPKEDKENIMESINQEIVSSKNIKPETSTAEANIKAVNSANSVKNRGERKAFRRLSAINENDLLNAEVKPLSKETDKLSYDLKELSVKAKRRTHFEGIPITIIEEKQHPMVTRKDGAEKTPTFELRSRTVHEEQAGRNLKRKSMFAASEVPAMKYQAMAEQVFHFQRDTPPRFHTSSRRSSENHKQLLKSRLSYKPRRTNALTPKLMTAMRSRPEPVALSHEERENLEMEEIKKYQVKALPLNEKVLLPPRPLRKSLRPPLVPEPFNLTHVFKKPAPKVEGEPYTFTAKPVPRTILKRCVGVGPKTELPVTVPQSPAITKSMRHQRPVRVSALSNDNEEKEEDLASYGVPIREPVVGPKKTQTEPFSFEPRDKEMLERKQKKIQEIYEAERKAREFKAKPVPAFVASRDSSRVSHMDTSTQVEEVPQPFRARSPRVLRKSPFKPILEHSHSQPLDVQLWTGRRATERQQFEYRQLEKEQLMACLREEVELEKKKKEEEEVARLRQETVHKAQPMPKFKPLPKRSPSTIPLTDPKSPRLTKRTRNNASQDKTMD